MKRHEYLQRRTEFVQRGTDLPQSKLTEDDVIDIRSIQRQRAKLLAHIKENLSNDAMAKKYNIHPRTLEKILSRETWSHVL